MQKRSHTTSVLKVQIVGFAQAINVSSKENDLNKEPLPGVNIPVEGRAQGMMINVNKILY
ncbi:hypothetical protein J1N10_17750 [Carboxylicivirga sp. A043]|uniref:hypothetical protein n=1 Tax=Carboxylicivirga litoralis TaxID=2816963 RepID=UPI0021CB15BC|nr:hypothetical protein [Carboxylicivirga sp. A043]MCU4157823.1 hypothetical protein [Carboxylicivirga sp. A043]